MLLTHWADNNRVQGKKWHVFIAQGVLENVA